MVDRFEVTIGSSVRQGRDLQSRVSAAGAPASALGTATSANDRAALAQSATALDKPTHGFAWGLVEALSVIGDSARATTAFPPRRRIWQQLPCHR